MLLIAKFSFEPARAAFVGFALVLCLANAKADPAAALSAPARVEQRYQIAKAQFSAETNNVDAAWQFARSCFDRAEFADNNAHRAMLANEGIAASRQLIARDPRSAPAYYYLALNMGQLARTKTLGALKLVDQMEVALKKARSLDPHFDYAGPDRALGLLYLDAPGWPASIGSRSKAREHLQRAVQLHPEYPENSLCLAEAYLKWNNRSDAREQAKRLQKIWPEARKQFSGEAWVTSWADWDKRWEMLQSRLGEEFHTESPRTRD